MKCPHCNGEHPDNFKFCPETGERIEPQLKACTNKDCPDYGKSILPLEAKFCPRCGKQIQTGEIQDRDELAKPSMSDFITDESEKIQFSESNAVDFQFMNEPKRPSVSDMIDKADLDLFVNWFCDEFSKEYITDWRKDSELVYKVKEAVSNGINKYNSSSSHMANISIPVVLRRDKDGRPVHTRNFERTLSRKIFYALKYPELIEDESWGWESVSYLNYSLRLKRYGNKYGVVDSDGIIILPCEYDLITLLESGNFLLKNEGKYGIVNRDENINVTCKYDAIKDFIGSLAEAKLEGKWYRIDKSGNIVEVKEADGWRYSIKNGIINISGIVLGKTDISNIASVSKMEGLGELLYYASSDGRLFLFQRVTQNYASVIFTTNPDIFIKMKRTVHYLKLIPTKNRYNEAFVSIYQTTDLLWKFAFCESEKNLSSFLIVEYSSHSHIFIEYAMAMINNLSI